MCGSPGGAEHQGQGERQEIQLRRPGRAVLPARLQQRRPARSRTVHRRAEQRGQVEPVLGEHPHGHGRGPEDQQCGLDDLHPRGALHAADQHVGDHHGADHGDHQSLLGSSAHPEQQRDKPTGAGHLGQQVEEADHQGRGCGGRPHGPLAQAEAQHVGHREPPGVAQQLRDEQQCHQPGHEEADRVEEPVVAVERDRPGDGEEARGGQVVPGDRDAVLRPGEGSAAGCCGWHAAR